MAKPLLPQVRTTDQEQPESAEQLMERYASGENEAFDALFAHIGPRVYAYLVRRSPEAADDLLQITFTKLHRVREQYRPAAPVMPWVLVIAARTLFDYRAVARRTVNVGDEVLAAVPAAAHEPHPMTEEIRQAVAQLPEPQRQVILMHKYQGMSLAEVAQATGSSVLAVKLRAHRAYNKLRKLLGPR